MSFLWDYIKPFLLAGMSGCTATACIHPIDTLKVKIQVQGEEAGLALMKGEKAPSGTWYVFKSVIQNEGVLGFYRGITSAIIRQAIFGTVRLGLYRSCADSAKQKKNADLSLLEKIEWSSFSAIVACIAGNPPDVCLVRFQTDSMLPLKDRRNYKNIIDALSRIIKEEGVLTLWRGTASNMARAIGMTVGQLATYDQVKEKLKQYQKRNYETSTDRLLASAAAGLCASILALPFDNCKTKLQKMKANEAGVFPYKGITDAFFKNIDNQKRRCSWPLDRFPSVFYKSFPLINYNLACPRFLVFIDFKKELINEQYQNNIKYKNFKMQGKIAGFLSDTLVVSQDITDMIRNDQGLMDRRSTRILDRNAQQNNQNPLNLVNLSVNFPKFIGDISSKDESMKTLFATNYQQQIQQLSNLPNLDVCQQLYNQSQALRSLYAQQIIQK